MEKIIQTLYNIFLRRRRIRKLTSILLPYLPTEGTVLDLGCGNGDLASALSHARSRLHFTGLEMYPLAVSIIERFTYNGTRVPYPDASFDYVMIITVLHHTDDYNILMNEARRVARKAIIIVDHQYRTRWDWLMLAIIDWPGNVPFGVYTPYNFKKRLEWVDLFAQAKMKEIRYDDRLYMFGKYADFLFGRQLHFISLLEKIDETT